MEQNNSELIKVVQENQIEPTQAELVLNKFKDFLDQAKEWEAKSKGLEVTDESQIEKMADARNARLILKAIRVNTENTRKELKEQHLRVGRAIDGVANIIKAIIVPIEEHLEKQEKFIENKQKEAEAEKLAERFSTLAQYVKNMEAYNLADMSDETFAEVLKNAKIVFEKEQEELKQAEEKKIKEQKEKEAEQERIRIENEKLKKEAKEREEKENKEKVEREKFLLEEKNKREIELKKIEDDKKKKEEEHQKELAKEREKAEQERKRLEDDRRKEQEAREKLEKEAEEKRQAELKAKQEADAKLKAEQESQEKAIRDERLKPEREKLVNYAEMILVNPPFGDYSKAGLELIKQTQIKLLEISHWLKEETKNL